MAITIALVDFSNPKDLTEGDAHWAAMNYDFRLTVARDPALQVLIPAPKHYDASRYSLLADWLRDQRTQQKPVKLRDIIDRYARLNGKFELNNKQSSIFSRGHFGGQFDWADASYEQRARIYENHMEYTLGLLHFLADDDAVPAYVQAEMKTLGLHRDEFADNGRLPNNSTSAKPAACTNLLVRCAASYTRVAFCRLSLESVWMITGHAAGIAAAMAAQEGSDVQKVNVLDL